MGGYVESYRGHVLASECDLFGHMNVQFYTTCISQAMATMFGAVGLTADEIGKRNRGFAAVEQNCRYFSEILAGDIVHMESGILKTSSKTVTFYHRLFNGSSKVPSFTSTITAAYMDLSSRKAVELDDMVLSNIEGLIVDGEEKR